MGIVCDLFEGWDAGKGHVVEALIVFGGIGCNDRFFFFSFFFLFPFFPFFSFELHSRYLLTTDLWFFACGLVTMVGFAYNGWESGPRVVREEGFYL